ncbi:metallophosphoesterase [Arhodomonas sp. AD133]|uniref:metallophosphoesterase n=1 Tax=Arhodomonas sp. AD133 TaxID=3415009 RepID=UPI003EBAF208
MDANSTEPRNGVKPLRVIQISDTHLFEDETARLAGVATDASARDVFEAALAQACGVDLVVVTGDLVHDGSVTAYRRLRDRLRAAGAPVLVVPGNHDGPDVMRRVFDDGPVRWCESCRVGAWQVESLNSHRGDDPGGSLGEAQLEAFTRRLAAGSGPVLTLVHHPPVALGAPWLDRIGLADGPELVDRLAASGRPAVVVWGHAHQAWAGGDERLRLLGAPSTCVQFAPGCADFTLDTRPPGWRWLSLYRDGAVETGVERLPAGMHAAAMDCGGY